MGDVAHATKCPDCGTVLTPDLPQGLCPKCLLASSPSLAETARGFGPDGSDVATSLGAAWRALSGDSGSHSEADVEADVAPEDLRPPQIPRYQIGRLIGVGGMGAVYEAEQQQPRRTVALKIIRPGKATRRLVRRFRDEAEALGRLQHPGIAQIYDLGMTESDGTAAPRPFFVMELVRGPGGETAPTITEFARTHRLTVRQRLELVAQVADAVHHAHQKGIIHRDLKPANILLGESGQPKVLDFGVARVTDSDVQATTAHGETNVGQIIGTLPYMSPEQAGGEVAQLDTRSDVYALGVLCYELLADRLPYQLGRLMLHEAVRVIREEEPTRLSTVDRTLRGDVETIVSTALAKEKERRYQSAAEMAADVRRFLRDEPLAARKAGTWYQLSRLARRNKALVVGVAAVFAALVLGLAATAWQAVQASRAREDARQRLRDSYVAQARALRWSGRSGWQTDSLSLIPKARSTRDGSDLRNEAVAALASADLHRLRAWESPAGPLRFDGPARRYAYHHGDGTIGVHNADDDALLLSLAGAGADSRIIRFSPDGRYLASHDSGLTVRVWDLANPARPITLPEKSAAALPIAFTPDSSAVAVSDGLLLHLFKLPSLDKRTLSLGTIAFRDFWFSPGGGHVAICRSYQGGDSVDVHGLSDGTQVTALHHDGFRVQDVAWEPQGDRVATASSDGNIRVFDWQDGSLRATLHGHTALASGVAYSPDGTTIASLGFDGTARLWDADGGEEVARADAGGTALQFSDNGRRLAFSGNGDDDQRRELWEVSPAALRVLRGGQWGVAFSPDGRVLAGTSGAGVALWDARLGRRLATLSKGPVSSLAFTPDGAALFAYGSFVALRYPLTTDRATGVLSIGKPTDALAGASETAVVGWSRTGPTFFDTAAFERPPLGANPSYYEAVTSSDGRWGAATLITDLTAQNTFPGWGPKTVVHVWDRQTKRLVATFPAPRKLFLRFSPDSRWFVACADGDARVWETGTWALRYRTDRGLDGGELAFSGDGRVAALPVSTNLVRLFDTDTWQELVVLESPHRRRPNGVAFSPGGNLLAVACVDDVVHLWDLRAIRNRLVTLGLDWPGSPGTPAGAGPARQARAVAVRLEEEAPGRGTARGTIPPRDPAALPELVDLSAYYNVSLTQSIHPLPNDTPVNDLAELPRGIQTFAGTRFDVRGIVHLGSKATELRRFPPSALDIRVRQKCRRLQFLHSASWQDVPGVRIGNYRIRYADGEVADVPIYYARDVWDWWQVTQNVTDPRSKVAWRGSNPAAKASGKGLILFKLTWENPRPEVEVVSVDFESAMRQGSAPFLVALTAEP